MKRCDVSNVRTCKTFHMFTDGKYTYICLSVSMSLIALLLRYKHSVRAAALLDRRLNEDFATRVLLAMILVDDRPPVVDRPRALNLIFFSHLRALRVHTSGPP